MPSQADFEKWWEDHRVTQSYDQMDEAIECLCKDAARAAFNEFGAGT